VLREAWTQQDELKKTRDEAEAKFYKLVL